MSEIPLSWAIDVQALTSGKSLFSYDATKDERAALAKYIAALEVQSFIANIRVRANAGDYYHVDGTYRASVTQASVVSLNPVTSQIEEPFSVSYLPEEVLHARKSDGDDADIEGPEPLVNGQIPIGSLLSELLAVALEPYPRNEGEVFEWTDTADMPKNPFSELLHLKPGATKDKDELN